MTTTQDDPAISQTRRFYKRPIFFIPVIVVAIPAVWVVWWLGSPLFLDKTVIEDRPTALIVTATTGVPAAGTATTAPPPTIDVQPEGPPPAAGEPAVAPVVEPSTPAPAATSIGAPQPTTTTVVESAEPVVLLAGMFKDGDSRHHGSGDAAVYELVDGSFLLRVENLDVTNGPDLHVFLTPLDEAMKRADVMADGYLDLGGLKGNKGDQNYVIPGGTDLSGQWTVVIYCVPFHVIFSTAPLA